MKRLLIIAAVAVIALVVLYGTDDKTLQGAISKAFENASSKITSVTNKSNDSGT